MSVKELQAGTGLKKFPEQKNLIVGKRRNGSRRRGEFCVVGRGFIVPTQKFIEAEHIAL